MNRKKLKSLIEEKSYLKGGTKEACLKAKEFLRGAICEENTIQSTQMAVNADEFREAVKLLVAFASKHADEVPKRWTCDEDCKRIFEDICPGEFGIDKNSKNKCPFFIDDGMV